MGASVAKKKKLDRIEIRADAAWARQVEAEAERWGMAVAAYIRLAVNEKMERDRRGEPKGEG